MGQPVMNPEFWKERLESYDELRYSVFLCSDSEWKEINDHHYIMLNKYIDIEKDRVLEAGCGYGRWSSLFKNYTGVDISPDFIELAKINNPIHSDNFICKDLRKLPFEDNYFDWCFTISTKGMIIREVDLETWNQIEKEILRVSKKFLVLEYGASLLSNLDRDNIEIIVK